jgi:hypothetical protein
MTSTRELLFGPIADTYLWCLHCERTYPKTDYRQHGSGLQLCAYKDCDGDAVLDAWAWSKVRFEREDTYPEVPAPGVFYPLHP